MGAVASTCSAMSQWGESPPARQRPRAFPVIGDFTNGPAPTGDPWPRLRREVDGQVGSESQKPIGKDLGAVSSANLGRARGKLLVPENTTGAQRSATSS